MNSHWMRFVDGKQALYIFNYTPSRLSVNTPLQLGDMWNPASVATVTPGNQSAGQTANKQFKWNENDTETTNGEENSFMLNILLTSDWLFLKETFIQEGQSHSV